MHDPFRVKVADGEADLEGVKFDNWFWKTLVGLEDFVQFTTSYEGHHEVEPGLGLEKVVHAAKEWMIATEQNILLQSRVLHLLEVQ